MCARVCVCVHGIGTRLAGGCFVRSRVRVLAHVCVCVCTFQTARTVSKQIPSHLTGGTQVVYNS